MRYLVLFASLLLCASVEAGTDCGCKSCFRKSEPVRSVVREVGQRARNIVRAALGR